MAWQPSKYETQYQVSMNPGVRLVVMFDKNSGSISRFAAQLQHLADIRMNSWKTFSQIDHEPANPQGHDLYQEGFHVDIYYRDGSKTDIKPGQPQQLQKPVGVLLRRSLEYLENNVEYFGQVSKRQISLSSPPRYP